MAIIGCSMKWPQPARSCCCFHGCATMQQQLHHTNILLNACGVTNILLTMFNALLPCPA